MTLSVGNFSHNFCESRVFNNQPELFNAISSLFITIIPFFYNIPNNTSLRRVTFILIINGICSSYYHYYLTWFGKQIDEITMVYALYIGTIKIMKLVDIGYVKDSIQNKYIIYDIFTMSTVAINTLPNYNDIFPFMYFLGVLFLLYNIYILKQNISTISVKCLSYSFYGFILWVLSEIFCNRYFYFGHSLWHILFPLGFIKFMNVLDNSIPKINIIKYYS